MIVVPMTEQTVDAAAALAQKLWPDAETLRTEFEAALPKPDFVVFLAQEAAVPMGFAQCQLRYDYVEGCDASPVGYLEGIYVEPEYRKKGAARALLSACETWAKEKGCTEFASDCELTNADSICFHQSVGFEEMNRIVCFKKSI